MRRVEHAEETGHSPGIGRHTVAPPDIIPPTRAPRARDVTPKGRNDGGRPLGAVALKWYGTRRHGPDPTTGRTRTERHKTEPVNTGQYIRMQTHNPWVVGSSPTRPTEVGHPTTRLTWVFSPFSPLWSRPSDGLSGESGREVGGARNDLGRIEDEQKPRGNSRQNPWAGRFRGVRGYSGRSIALR